MSNEMVYLNGRFVKLKDAKVSILDRGLNYGDGLFETMRAYSGNIFCIESHLERLFISAESIFLQIPLTQQKMASVIKKTIQKNRCSDAYIRLTITRGSFPPGLLIDTSISPTIVVYVQSLKSTPKNYYNRGVGISLFPSTAIKTSGIKTQIKSCDYLSRIIIREMAKREGSYEGILLEGKNKITEGSASNIFILKNGILKTPKITPYILPGITRRVVIDIAREQNIKCSEQVLSRKDLYESDEAFLTNSMIEILPINQVDGRKIGTGNPGRVTRLLHKTYLKMVYQG